MEWGSVEKRQRVAARMPLDPKVLGRRKGTQAGKDGLWDSGALLPEPSASWHWEWPRPAATWVQS